MEKTKLKVLLISHPWKRRQRPDYPHPGIAYLGAVANNLGHDVKLIDGGLWSISRIVKETQSFAPDLIGITCWTFDRDMLWKLCFTLKKVIPHAFLVIGGTHATIYPKHIFEKTHASAVVVGEGEETFSELLPALESGIGLSHIKGLVYKNDSNEIVFNEPRLAVRDIDEIEFPYYSGFNNFSFAQYEGSPVLPGPTAAIISSRGCVYKCTFCASQQFWGNKWRFRSANNVLEEIHWLISKFGIKSIHFYDDNIPVDKKRVLAICEGMVKNKWDLKWSCASHVNMISKDLLLIMKASGCVSIDFGVESGSDKILENIKKRQTRKQIIETFRLCHEVGIMARSFLIVGNMGEDETTIDETIDLVKTIQPRSSIGSTLLWLLPGTEVYQNAVKKGFIDEDYWLHNDGIPYNLQEYSLAELERLRKRLMLGIAKSKGDLSSIVSYHLKAVYYKYPALSVFRSFVPSRFR